LVACDNGGGGATGRGPLTKAEFIERADAICEDTERRIQALEPPATTNDLDEYAASIGEIGDEGIRELRALQPPPGDLVRIRNFIGDIESSVELLPAYARAAQQRDGEQLGRIETRLQDIADQSRAFAQDYGFRRCGGDEGAPAE
jgi:hypothetical protein